MWTRVMVGVAFVLLLGGEALAQCRVEGVVRALDGSPVAGATVVLDPPRSTTTTDANGHYVFEGVKAGTRVLLFASKAGRPIASAFPLVSDLVETVDIRERSALPLAGKGTTVEVGQGSRSDWGAGGQQSMGGQDLFGDLLGRVTAADGRSIADASVSLEDPAANVTSDSSGRFSFVRLPAGLPVVVHAGAPGYEPVTQELIVAPGKPVEVKLTLKPAAKGEAVPEPSVPLFYAQTGTAAVSLRPNQLTGLPNLGEKDLFHTIRLLPGVDGSQETTSGLGVRGGTPDQTLVTLDGVTLYNVDLLTGYLSALDMDGVQKAEFSESAASAADGGRLGGVLKLSGQTRAARAVSGSVDGNLLNYGGFLSVPFGDWGSVMVAGRQSYPSALYDRTLDIFATGGAQPARGQAAIYSAGVLRPAQESRYYDLNGKLELKPTRDDRLSVTYYDALNDIDHSRNVQVQSANIDALLASGLNVPRDLFVHTSDVQNWTSRAYGATWMRQWSPAISTTLTAGHSEFNASSDWATLVKSPTTGVDYSALIGRGGSNALTDASTIKDTTFRIESQVTPGFTNTTTFGAETKSLDIGYNALTEVIKARRPDGSFASTLIPLLNRTASARLITAFVQNDWSLTPRLLLSQGMRATYYNLTSSSYFEPRMSLTFQATTQARIRAGWGVDDQMALRVTHEDLTQGDREFWTLADGLTVPVARAQQAYAGIGYTTPEFLVDVKGYYKFLDDLTIFAPRLIPGVAPAPGATLMHHGSGNAYGADVILQQKASWNTGWLSYSLARVQYDFPTLELGTFLATQSHTHDLKVADVLRIGPRWTLGATWMLSSGRPVTPATTLNQVWLPNGATVYQIAFAAKNSDQLPVYHRLDLSSEFAIRVSVIRASLGVSVFNVYDRKNVWFHEYQVLATAPTLTDMYYLGRTFNVFARIGF